MSNKKTVSLSRKLIAGFGRLLLILSGVVAGVVVATSNVTASATLTKDESAVFAEKAQQMKFDLALTQSWLHDISATRAMEGFDDGFVESDKHAASFLENLHAFKGMFERENNTEFLAQIAAIEERFAAFRTIGRAMAEAYIEQGAEAGNAMMGEFDEAAETLMAAVNPFIESQMVELDESMASVVRASNLLLLGSICTGVFTIGLGVVLAWFITRSISGPINRISDGLGASSEQTSAAAAQVSSSGQTLAQGASEQAAAVEETTSSIEQMSSMIQQNAGNANQAKQVAGEATGAAEKGRSAMTRMVDAINEVKQSSTETAAVIKTIDDIAFQTNLLALNAAVEAARAGEAGKGFAVVAEEVRNLAQRSAESAKNTAAMIQEAGNKADNSVQITREVVEAFGGIIENTSKVDDLVAEIAAASSEQAAGIEQISMATTRMDQVAQGNAASAQESASASEELSAQAEELNNMVNQLRAVINGSAGMGDFGDASLTSFGPAASGGSSESLQGSDSTWHQISGDMTESAPARQSTEDVIPMGGGKKLEDF